MIVENSLISSLLWSIVPRFRLTQNMRANPGEEDFKSFLLDMGDGKLPLKTAPPFPKSTKFHTTSLLLQTLSTIFSTKIRFLNILLPLPNEPYSAQQIKKLLPSTPIF